MTDQNIDAECLFNLDECGVTPGKHLRNGTQRKRYFTRGADQDLHEQRCAYSDRIHAGSFRGWFFGTMSFVLKGKRTPYRLALRNHVTETETPGSKLPFHSVVALRSELGGVDSTNFFNWACVFVDSVKGLTTDCRKVLLVYEGYRSHMFDGCPDVVP